MGEGGDVSNYSKDPMQVCTAKSHANSRKGGFMHARSSGPWSHIKQKYKCKARRLSSVTDLGYPDKAYGIHSTSV